MAGSNKVMSSWFFWSGWFAEKLESWLQDQAAAGWHLTRADRWLLRFRFERGTPRRVKICVDYPAGADEDYIASARAAGWELVSRGLGWYIWRKELWVEDTLDGAGDAAGAVDRACPGVTSPLARNRRLLQLLITALIIQIPVPIPFLTRPVSESKLLQFAWQLPLTKMLVGVYGALVVSLIICVILVLRRNSCLLATKH